MDVLCCCLDHWRTRHRKHEDDGGAGHHDEEDDMDVVELPPYKEPAPAPQPAKQQAPASQAVHGRNPSVNGQHDLIGLHEVTAGSAAAAAAAGAPPSSLSSLSPPAKSQEKQPPPSQQQQLSSPPTAPSREPAPPAPAPSPSRPLSTSASPFGRHKAAAAEPSPSRQKKQREEDEADQTNDDSEGTSSPKRGPAPVDWAQQWAPVASAAAAAEGQEKARREFLEALGQGIVCTKHDRKGRSRLRELYTPDGGQSFSWRNPTGGGGGGHHRGRSSGGGGGGGGGASVFEWERACYTFHEILEVRRGTVPDPSTGGRETGTENLRAACPKHDLYKSFSIILKDRTVDWTCESMEQLTYLVKGLTTLMTEQKRKARGF